MVLYIYIYIICSNTVNGKMLGRSNILFFKHIISSHVRYNITVTGTNGPIIFYIEFLTAKNCRSRTRIIFSEFYSSVCTNKRNYVFITFCMRRSGGTRWMCACPLHVPNTVKMRLAIIDSYSCRWHSTLLIAR